MRLLHSLGMESDLTWKHLGALTNRIACRLTAVREGKIFAGDALRPAYEEGAAAGTYTPTAAGEPVNLGGEEGTVARQYRMKTASHFAPPSSAATAASNFARQSASCS